MSTSILSQNQAQRKKRALSTTGTVLVHILLVVLLASFYVGSENPDEADEAYVAALLMSQGEDPAQPVSQAAATPPPPPATQTEAQEVLTAPEAEETVAQEEAIEEAPAEETTPTAPEVTPTPQEVVEEVAPTAPTTETTPTPAEPVQETTKGGSPDATETNPMHSEGGLSVGETYRLDLAGWRFQRPPKFKNDPTAEIGVVKVEFVVDEFGQVVSSEVVMESTDVSYPVAKFYAEQVKKLRFEPEKMGGMTATQTIGQLVIKITRG
jgi:hypothetical protein